MFDIGFSELVLIFLVGLVVLGPQRMPVAIRTVMGWVRTIRGLAHNVQTELAQELKLQELQESIKKAEALNISNLSPELSKTVEELKQSAQKMQETLNSAKGEIQGLSDQQVADIQNRIEQEHQTLSSEQVAELHQAEGKTPEELVELAELHEGEEHPDMDTESLHAYYPPDEPLDTAENPTLEQEKSNVS
ncbi:Sec-independent protein translocase protein TatB [Bibersteinia trehalosi USDA-ARS-USMARC-188]|uniref:Sec-independent protein translocase protein TatB n=3 Tax=Bibersteinia trehalosi TaxID=47735 RepID=A0A4V7I7B3_BIBTR|nr:Sec-independent protein translocase protein TatB [Bibersteinia trehalosi]AGH39385.1 Sec-independent protein translocase protein TatB [Bibersteinia trehalosi USDA-ARS-USMARC-192]AHG80869.1 Sec-independent protein translocase protein TatB [Bibersteinia trehalosi USDA-ARS-USMARC-188]AHG83019.1 Sec-independent protein translocase protein TatB [Bibersteinia trehalosi USDA-ARS-USMARC-189]OAQ14099.1 translocase [Bibersteinia trehalosi Y31]